MIVVDDGRAATDLEAISTAGLATWRRSQPASVRDWPTASGFAAAPNQFVRLPGPDGLPGKVIAGIGERATVASFGQLAMSLPAGDYRLIGAADDDAAYALALGWGLGGYRFANYRPAKREPARLLVPPRIESVGDELAAVGLCRDLINTPASDMLPHDLESAARKLAIDHGADIEVTTGEALLRAGYRTIYAVGQASASAPRLIDLRWGDPAHERVTLVGKGVCFDSGGLNLKPASNMRLMKKDMGGAAHVLGLAKLVMSRNMPVRLRVLVPAVENAVSANAYRPGDVIRTYQGRTVEIDNTDAEGRLVLADALAVAAEEKPAVIVDYATLTGAARSALGTELPALFSNDDDLAAGIQASADRVDDAVWRMPLFAPYRRMLDSKVADLVNSPASPYAGAITAALFLEHFVGDTPWVHFDIMAWNLATRPARPEGGEAMGLRAVYDYLAKRSSV
ncbi:MAG: leucyl aminopeptidase family protein [Gammaproteobacteria bacterium]|nr:leucyl aminopeptidase family protein [Gammaproteobacteria bacterium]